MKMEILYFDGCPTYLASEKALREVLEEQGIAAEVELVAGVRAWLQNVRYL